MMSRSNMTNSLVQIRPDDLMVESGVKCTFPSELDRRARPRFEIRAPLTILDHGREISTFTRDISSIGVFFYMPPADAPSIGQVLKFSIELSADVTFSEVCRIQCVGKVIRINRMSSDEVGVATLLSRYSFVPAELPRPNASAAGS